MNKIREFFKRIIISEKSAPFAFLAACILSFGLLIPNLGFYMDDWPYVFYARLKGIDSLREMLVFDSRPNAAWLYMLGFYVLGFKPMAWHVSALLLRFATVLAFWLFLQIMWAERKREAIVISLLFAIFPFFMLQPFAVGSTHHWFGFLAFNCSLILMALAVRDTSFKKWIYIIGALGLEAAHLFTSEYFAGLELIRTAVLWILFSRVETNFSRKIGRVLLNWIPYLIILGFFVYWRVVLYQNPEGVTRNEPVVLMQLFTQPFEAIRFLVTAFLTDGISVLTLGWGKASDVSTLDFASPFVLFKIVVCVIGFALAYFYLGKLWQNSKDNDKSDWGRESITLALAAMLTGGLPIWFIGRSIVESKNLLSASRFGIPAMFGASLLTFLLVDFFISDKNKKSLFLAFALALAVNFHLDNTREFQYSWEKQERFAQQLIWRAPSIAAGTSLLTDQEVMGVMGEYAVSFSINTTYQAENFGNTPPYWYFPFYYTNPNVGDLLEGAPLEYEKMSMVFAGNSRQMLLLDFNPELNRCLWVLQPQDVNLRLVGEDVRQLAAGSDISLIQQTETEPSLPEDIYGRQNNKGWCYYFQKADLARQFGQWDEVLRLWNESQSVGERADNGFEYIPFIEGFGHAEDWGQVKTLIKFSKRITAGLEPSLCSALDRLAAGAPASQERDDTISSLKDDLNCSNFQ
ncbi:MAG: hypothetical protein IH589_01580 [Anaerolineales bacterium]|nr:hypothetical protein [Anaerolineales bacterium]